MKIEWSQKENPESPYSVQVPDTLKRVGFIEKAQRLGETDAGVRGQGLEPGGQS